MDDFLGILLAVTIVVGGIVIASSTLDGTVITHCKEKGVYYYGQTKMLCTIEDSK